MALLLFALIRGRLDVWLLGEAALALAAGAVLGRKRGRSAPERAGDAGGDRRPAVADTLLAAMPDPVIRVGRRRVVLDANDAARTHFPGLKAGDPLSFVLRDPDVLQAIDEVLASGRAGRAEYVGRVPTERAFEVRIAPLAVEEPDDRRPSSVALFFRDLTASRRLERMRVDFVANASHELRTPLASLLGFIDTLQGPARNDPAARERFLDIMREQGRRMNRLIDDLLSLSRIELSVHVPPAEPVDVGAVTREMVDTLAPLARERGVEITLEVDAGPAVVRGDRDELSRVATNLIENAIKYGASGGRVEVAVRRVTDAAPAVELSVRDHGPGIAPEHLPRLTERFYRVDVSESRQKGGTGLGLAIVKHIVQRHRGRLAVESELGRGALFQVTIPAPEGS